MGLKSLLQKLDVKLDKFMKRGVRHLESATEKREDVVERPFRKTFRGIDAVGDKLAVQMKKASKLNVISSLTKRPRTTLLIITVIALLIGSQALYLQDSIQSDIEVYLPPGDPSTEILEEVRVDWPTDVIVIYVEVRKPLDITKKPILDEMSKIEDALNTHRGDRGKDDGVFYVLSISSLIKEINNATGGGYTIPDQNKIDRILIQISGSGLLERFVRDTNGDGYNDSAAILVGIPYGVDQDELIQDVETSLKNVTLSGITTTITGQPAIMQSIQKRTVTEFLKVLPLIFVFIALVLFFFHRTFKLLILSALPMFYAIAITFGFIGVIRDQVVVAPQIILVAPLLVAFGIVDSLYIANYYAEYKHKDPRTRAVNSVNLVKKAILLTTLTTGAGFASLCFGTLKPLFTVGLALVFGIIMCFVLTVTMVPCLILLLDYRKRYTLRSFKGVGKIPIAHSKKIIAFALVIMIVSVGLCLPLVECSADYYAMAPQDEPSVIKMQEYSTLFGAGQPGLILIWADPSEYATLEGMEKVEWYLTSQVPGVQPLSIVDLMKAVTVNSTMAGTIIENINETLHGFIDIDLVNMIIDEAASQEVSYWRIVQSAETFGKSDLAISIFYEMLSDEMKSIFINEDSTKTLIFLDMKVMPMDETRDTVRQVNLVAEHYGGSIPGSVSSLTGMAAILVAVNDLTISNQQSTIVLALLICFIVLAIILWSIKLAAITLVPVCLVVAYIPMTFIGANVELSLITMMIASIIIGVGVDYGIHLTHRIRKEGLTLSSVENATEGVGISFLEATVTMVAGLSAALIVPIESIKQFIVMIILLLIISMITALFILPAIYAVWVRGRGSIMIKGL